jgi:hypothetical protein
MSAYWRTSRQNILKKWYTKSMNKHARSLATIVLLGGIIIGTALIGMLLLGQKKALEPQGGQVVQNLISPSGKLTITNLVQNQAITLPMTITGVVQGWFFEGSFPVFMKDGNGNQIGVALASSSQDWMTANPIPFTVTLPAVNYTGPGTLVFTKDNPSGEPQFDDSFVVNVVF